MTAPTTTDPLTPMERQSLTIWGETISAQIRDDVTIDDYLNVTSREQVLMLHIRDDAPRSTENGSPAIVPASDVAKLRALLNEAATR